MARSIKKPSEQQKSWNFLATVFYVFCLVALGYGLNRFGITKEDFQIGDIALLSLATYRLTRILVFDKIFKLFRDFLKSREKLYVFYVIREIITCPWCAGVWVALIITALYFMVPYGDIFIILLSISGIASFLVVSINYIGLSTEEKQQEVKELRDDSDYSKL
jgi:hypothetical protein